MKPKPWWALPSMLFLVACAGVSQLFPPPQVPGVPTDAVQHPLTVKHGIQPTLLYRYHRINEKQLDNGQTRLEAQYSGLRYRPRQAGMLFPEFAGWDLLETPTSDSARNDWLRLRLNRDAWVVVVWEREAPWLTGWHHAETKSADGKKTFNAFRAPFRAGEASLGSPGKDNGKYWVLLAEANGLPSPSPVLPTSGLEPPQPNQTCPSWLEDQWQVQGYDGSFYQGWHPQIDPIYWCYYRHEHGSDPGLIGYRAAFTHVAHINNHQPERGEGFKGFAIRDEANGVGWYFNLHSETSTEQRVCARFHTVVVVATDLRTGELLVELAYKGDFGASRANQGDKPFINPGSCANQPQIAAQTSATKRIRVASIQNGGYEQWDGGLVKALGMSFNGNGMGIDIQNPATSCPNLRCDAVVVNGGSSSTRRNIGFNQLRISYDAFKDMTDGKRDGYFFTDIYGLEPAQAGQPLAIRQYIKPGTQIALHGGFATQDAWRGIYQTDTSTMDIELEGGIGAIN